MYHHTIKGLTSRSLIVWGELHDIRAEGLVLNQSTKLLACLDICKYRHIVTIDYNIMLVLTWFEPLFFPCSLPQSFVLAYWKNISMILVLVVHMIVYRHPLCSDHFSLPISRGCCRPVQMVNEAFLPLSNELTILLLTVGPISSEELQLTTVQQVINM